MLLRIQYVSLFLTLLSCQSRSGKIGIDALQNDLQEMNLNGKIKTIVYSIYQIYWDSSTLLLGKKIYNFDTAGNITGYIFIDSTPFHPSQHGTITAFKSGSRSDKIVTYRLIDQKGRFRSMRKLKYNISGFLIEEILYKRDSSVEWLRLLDRNPQNRLKAILCPGLKIVYKYDKNDQPILKIFIDRNKDSSVTWTTFNSRGFPIIDDHRFPSGHNTRNYKYEVDERGNPIKELEISNGDPEILTLSEIIYY